MLTVLRVGARNSTDTTDRGGAVGVEAAIVWIALLGLLGLLGAVIQVALVFYAGQLALTAAQDGVTAGRSQPSPTMAAQAAQDFLRRVGGTALTTPQVSAELDPAGTVLRVDVSGQAMSLVPGMPMTVHKAAAGAVEQVAP